MKQDALNSFNQIANSTIYLVGGSFILGSLFTLLVLVLLDFMQSLKHKEHDQDTGADH